jgi:hypothetical protein
MPGEKLEYAAKYSVLNLGTMILEIQDSIANMPDRPCYHLTSIIRSSKGLKWLFSLNDTISVMSTVNDLLPVSSIEITHEGKYHNRFELSFDHDIDSVKYNDSLSVELAENARDLVSFWYYLRTIPLNIGDTVPVNIHKSMENFQIDCLIVGYENIETPFGSFNTILVKPQTAGKGVFGSSGSMSIWYSNDKNRYPVQILAKMKIGTVVFQLTGVDH